MSIAMNNKIIELEQRIATLERLVTLLTERKTLSLPKKSDAKAN
jgi:hypothetical protein